MPNTFNNGRVSVLADTADAAARVDENRLVAEGEAVLVTVVNGEIQVHTLAANDAGIAGLIKTLVSSWTLPPE